MVVERNLLYDIDSVLESARTGMYHKKDGRKNESSYNCAILDNLEMEI